MYILPPSKFKTTWQCSAFFRRLTKKQRKMKHKCSSRFHKDPARMSAVNSLIYRYINHTSCVYLALYVWSSLNHKSKLWAPPPLLFMVTSHRIKILCLITFYLQTDKYIFDNLLIRVQINEFLGLNHLY